MKFVTVTPAGRRRYLEILATYLLRNRDVIDEHHWWLNTRDPHDVAYIYRLADRYPDFFRVIVRPDNPKLLLPASIWCYLRDYTDQDAIYARFDDDICYMTDDAIANLRRYREENPEPLLVLGNIVNNAVCSHSHQQAGLIPTSWGAVGNECMDEIGWGSGAFARRLHHQFLQDIERRVQGPWQDVAIETDGASRFSINVISWFGRDLQGLPELATDKIDEEPFLTAELPARLGRPNVICSEALFGHYAFYPQRHYLERTSPDILARYRAISQEIAMPTGKRRPFLARTYDELRSGTAAKVWDAVDGVRNWKRRRAA
jgi:hypothetical protein